MSLRKTSQAASRSPRADATKGGVERFRRLWHARVRRRDGKVGLGLVDLSGLEIHSAVRTSAARRWSSTITDFCCRVARGSSKRRGSGVIQEFHCSDERPPLIICERKKHTKGWGEKGGEKRP